MYQYNGLKHGHIVIVFSKPGLKTAMVFLKFTFTVRISKWQGY